MESIAESTTLHRVIQDEAEYESVMAEFEILFSKHENRTSEETTRLRELMPVIKEYESRVCADLLDGPKGLPDLDAVDMILGHMDRLGLHQKDLAPLLGGQNRVSEVLNRKRPLTVKMMRALHDGLGISYDDLMRQAKNSRQ